MSENSDPKLLEKLKGVPPFGDEPAPEPAPEPVKEEKPVSERTKEQIEKLTGTNQELKSERDAALEEKKKLEAENAELKKKNLLESMRPEAKVEPEVQLPAPFEAPVPQAQDFSHLNQDQVDDVYAKLIDAEGYIDPQLLKQTLKDANDRALRAEQAARQAQSQVQQVVANTARKEKDFEESSTMKTIHEQYPQLDPNGKDFNPKFFEAVRNDLVSQLRASGKEDVMGAVERWKDVFVKAPVVTPEPQPEAVDDSADKKKQLSVLTGGGSGRADLGSTDHEILRQAAMHGAKGALAERLRRAGQ